MGWKVILNEDKKALTIRRVDDGQEVGRDTSEYPKGTPEDVLATADGSSIIIDRDVNDEVCAIGIISDEPMEVGVTAEEKP